MSGVRAAVWHTQDATLATTINRLAIAFGGLKVRRE